jgi:hypothetical protein
MILNEISGSVTGDCQDYGTYFHLYNQRITWSHILNANGMEGRNLKLRAKPVSSDMQSRRRMMYREADATATL